MRLKNIDLVVSVCATKDLQTWSVASLAIPKYIDSASYVVIVPEHAIKLFRENTVPAIQVISEETVLPSSYLKKIERHLDQNHTRDQRSRSNWLYQQFLKIEFARSCSQERILIWDADTVPLRPLKFFDEVGRPRYFTGNESHKPYFDLIRIVFGLKRSIKSSFVAQCLPFYGHAIESMLQEIESRSNLDWKSTILQAITPESGSSPFSEYETIGTWMCSERFRGPKPIPQKHGNHWLRNGYSHLGPACNLEIFTNHPSLRKMHFVTFENYHAPYSHYLPINQLKSNNKFTSMKIEIFSITLEFNLKKASPNSVSIFLRDFFEGAPLAVIVQIGANDGVSSDPLRSYLAHHAGKTILVEALPYYCAPLRKLYCKKSNISIVNAVIGKERTTNRFYFIDPIVANEMDGDGPKNRWAHGQGSFQRETIVHWIKKNQFRGNKYQQNISRYINSILNIELEAITLADIERQHSITRIDLLILHVQGAEWLILSTLKQLSKLPRFIIYEDDYSLSSTDSDQLQAFLTLLGYVFIVGDTDKLWGIAAQDDPIQN
ncbi:MAG: FkbM family methyltransferase [Rhodocyclaceae bacterium]|nr:FkbM family methyltransferase [Rhodocyclaceae bacterium]